MRNYIMLLLALCLHIAARGQTEWKYEYWFDDDQATIRQGRSTVDSWHLDADMSGLSESLHAFHIQVVGNDTLPSNPITRYFIKTAGQTGATIRYWFDDDVANANSIIPQSGSTNLDVSNLPEGLHTLHVQVVSSGGGVSSTASRLFYKTFLISGIEGRYWFDDDADNKYTSPQAQGLFDIDVKHLDEGFHTIHYQVLGTGGNVSSIVSRSFYKVYLSTGISWRCWFDNDFTTVQEGNNVDNTLLLDVTRISDGYHTLHIQVDGGSGAASVPITKGFVKIPQTIGVDDYTCLCMVDDQLFRQEKVPAGRGVVEWNFDVSQLSQGFHRMFVQIVTPSGAASNTYESFFLRETTRSEFGELKCVYAIDGAEFYTEAGTMANGAFHFDLDVSSLDDGLHRIAYMLSNGKGVTTKAQCQFFVKTPLGGNGITEYWYWLNEQGDEHAQKVTLPERQDPFSLISLLSVEHQPIRSKLFQFRVEDSQPVIYAKNDIHLRFYDAAGRFTDLTRQYIDEQVSQAVTDVEWLESGVRATTAKPEENAIKWYCLEAEFGDSLSFKTSMACAIQLFSPTGEKVYSASGSKSVTAGGVHAYEDGTYYLALHDITGTQNTNISVDYQKIDRYALLNYSPNTFGVPSIVNVSLVGNGFSRDASVYLVKDNNRIKATAVSLEDIAHLTANFQLDNIEKGKYNLRVVYTDTDSITIKNGITIEEADGVPDVEIEIEGNPFFIAGSSATYSIRFTNHSNIPVYSLPFTLTIDCNGDVANVPYLKFETDFKQQARQRLRMAFFDKCTPAELDALLLAVLGDDDLSMFYADTISERGKAYLVGDFVLPRLDGYSTLTIPFTIKKVNHDLTLYAFTKPHWRIQDFVNINHVDYSGGSSGSGSSGSGSSGSGSSGSGSSGSGSSGSGSSGSGSSGSGSSGSGSSGSGSSGSGSSGSGSSGSGSSGSGSGGVTSFCEDPCGPRLAIDCFMSIIESVNVLGSVGESVRECAGDGIKDQSAKIFSDILCNGEMPDLSDIQRNPAPVVVDITASVLSCIGWDIAKRLIGSRITKTIKIGTNCLFKPLAAWANSCPSDGGSAAATPIHSYDPNEIYGYIAESGSKAVRDEQTGVYYTIQFENEPEFATSAAHDIYLADTLDSQKFDLTTFTPTRIKIGEKSAELIGDKNFVTTIDMRPEINAIAQVTGTFNDKTGIAKWHITSLDPMTMEPTDDVMQGVLPVNYNGNGIGEVSYNISLKPSLTHGTEVNNRAGIVFDNNEVIMTPTWTNIIDRIAPESHVTEVKMLNDSTATVSIEAKDELSGPWRYNVYVQYGSGVWILGAENVPADTTANVMVYEGINHNFYVVLTDSAGNVEQKEAASEFSFEVFEPQVDTDTKLQLAQGWNWISHNQQEVLSAEVLKPKAQRILSMTDELYKDSRFGWTGDLNELLPTELYKVQMAEADEVQLSGKLFNAAFRTVPLYAGWNWMGYPVANTMTPAEALQKMEAEEGDFIIGQDGMATFTDGQWMGTLMQMEPGLGYMYRSVSDKNLFLNATAQASSRKVNLQRSIDNGQAVIPEDWTVDKRKYPNVMGLVANLVQDGETMDVSEWLVGAFCGKECRGLSQVVNGHLMMNVYGMGGERISFIALNRVSGEVMAVEENEPFRTDILGTMQQPYELHSGVVTGIAEMEDGRWKIGDAAIYDLQGRRVDKSSMNSDGIYIVTDGNKTQKHVNHKRKK